jgi:hypothetical protein
MFFSILDKKFAAMFFRKYAQSELIINTRKIFRLVVHLENLKPLPLLRFLKHSSHCHMPIFKKCR